MERSDVMTTNLSQSAVQPGPKTEGSSGAVHAADAAKKLAITITQNAVDAIGAQIKKRNVEGTALRVGIRGGGCSGFSYVIEFHDGAPHARDVVYDMTATDGSSVRVLIDKKSLLYLNGATLEWEKTVMRQGFKFVNPNESSSCGCGTSFNV